MSNLTNTQPPIYNDPNQKNGHEKNSEKEKGVGSIKPSRPYKEGTPIETDFSPETRKSPETLNPVETVPVPKKELTRKKTESDNAQTPQTVQKEDIKNVVDKTDQITTLHEVKQTEDKLTKEADEEEEHFIEEVEKHHGNL